MKRGVVVTNRSVESAKRHPKVVVVVIFQKHAVQSNRKALRVALADYHFCQNACLVRNMGSYQQVEIANVGVGRGTSDKTSSRKFRLPLVKRFVIDLAESAPLDTMQQVQFFFG